ncbi:ABC transporter related protein [Paenibacillus vortex V453]|uniref:ABC transporter related protein n=1 Tax=Paenibacillus vortex V453 TaxID=715225 RepID=A0A2R9SXW3_9BACL|nr:ABC transporter related protein [Paenibacillus vortex V453]
MGNYDDFRAKKDQLAAASLARELPGGRDDIALPKIAQQKAKEKTSAQPAQHSNRIRENPSSAERSHWLEEEIDRLERLIQQLDGWLETEGPMVDGTDAALLEQRWNERESLAANRDELLAEWLELS